MKVKLPRTCTCQIWSVEVFTRYDNKTNSSKKIQETLHNLPCLHFRHKIDSTFNSFKSKSNVNDLLFISTCSKVSPCWEPGLRIFFILLYLLALDLIQMCPGWNSITINNYYTINNYTIIVRYAKFWGRINSRHNTLKKWLILTYQCQEELRK